MRTTHLAALLGFAFVAAWIGFGFGDAILCLIGAAVFVLVALRLEGKLELSMLQRPFGEKKQQVG